MKRHYSEYAQHALRYYISASEEMDINSKRQQADTDNILAAQRTFDEMDDNRKELLKMLISAEDPLPVVVRKAAYEYNTTEVKIWGFLAYAEKRFAQFRGLI